MRLFLFSRSFMGMKPFTFTTQVVLVLETEKINAIKRNNKIQQL